MSSATSTFARTVSRAAFAALALLWLGLVPALAEKKVALVIGMSKYQSVPQLANPDNDAAAMTAVFQKAGFDKVESRRDLSIAEMRRAVREFAETARDADIAVVYYAGHGIEVDGVNYLIPADAKLISDFDVEDETVSLDRVLRSLDNAKRLRLVILDACRDNPFAKTMKRSIGGGTRSIGRGLAKVEPTSSDTLIAFAAKAGAVAADGDGRNSPFATALVKYITSPGLDLRLAFGRVRDEVLKSTGNRQEPFVYGSLGGETVALVPAAAAPPPDPQAEARRDYELAAQVGTKEAWAGFLSVHPDGFYAGLARAQADKLVAAEKASSSAEEARRRADEQAKQKAEEFRRQLEEQAAKQAEDTRRKLSEQSKAELEAARQQVAEQAKRDLDEARRQADDARRQAEEARKQVEAAKRQAAADAQAQVEKAREEARQQALKAQAEAAARAAGAPDKSVVASLSPAPAAAPPAPPVPAMDPADIARLLQAHLKRVGCDPGSLDGKWTEGSARALDAFNKKAKTTFDIKLASLDALDAVRGTPDRVCPLVCGKGQKADGERCVQITCDAGFVLGSDGSCRKKPEPVEPKRTAQAAPKPRAAAPAAAPSGGGGGGAKCFTFNGKRYCE
jgi:uncharacterized caspase-like protein